MTKQEVLDRAMKIVGKMRVEELSKLYDLMTGKSIIVEIGTMFGRSASLMAMTPGVDCVICVDWWQTDDDWNTFNKYVKDLIDSGNIKPVRSIADKAMEAVRFLAPQGVDALFIDANHTYPFVKSDIVNYKPMLRPNGIITGHDLDPNFPGVEQALKELLPGYKQEAMSIWSWQG